MRPCAEEPRRAVYYRDVLPNLKDVFLARPYFTGVSDEARQLMVMMEDRVATDHGAAAP